MNMKNKLFLATAIIALAACSDNTYLGDENGANGSGGAISFEMSTPSLTRPEVGGSEAASALSNQFVVYGYKTMTPPTTTPQVVFNNYQVNYVANTVNSTTSNSANWEYVGYTYLNAAMTGHTGVAGNATGDFAQTIKYWDYSAKSYKFYGYSLGAGKTGGSTTYANASLMGTADSYTLEGDQDQLASCYISELKTIADPNESTPTKVDLRFLSIKSQIQLGFYETIPGYSVKELKFYESSTDDVSDATPVIFAGTSILPKAGKYTVTFDTNGKPILGWEAASSDGTNANVAFASTLTSYAAAEYKEASGSYLGRSSNEATKTEVKNVLPYATGADLTLKVDYTLVSRDGSGETIEAKGATAKIPAAYTQWKPNYKYTYLFKISDKSNPLIGEVTGLYPITLDAVVASEQDGSQETITTVSEPSITSYAKAGAVLENNEYLTGNNIYVAVEDGTTNPTLTVGDNVNFYTVTIQDGAAQTITEASVANALVHGTHSGDTWTVHDALGKDMVVTKNNSLLAALSNIPAADSPTGAVLAIKCAKFAPAEPVFTVLVKDNDYTIGSTDMNGKYTRTGLGTTASPYVYHKITVTTTAADGVTYCNKTTTSAGYYVFEYIYNTDKKAYKVIKVVDEY